MKITTELLDNEIATMKARLEQAKASVGQLTGALSVLEDLRKFQAQPEPQPKTEISEANAAIQERDQAVADAYSLQEVAEIVAGPGATAEIEPIDETKSGELNASR